MRTVHYPGCIVQPTTIISRRRREKPQPPTCDRKVRTPSDLDRLRAFAANLAATKFAAFNSLTCPLLSRLPREIRDLIWGRVFGPQRVLREKGAGLGPLGLLLSCKQIAHEAIHFAMANTTFMLPVSGEHAVRAGGFPSKMERIILYMLSQMDDKAARQVLISPGFGGL